MRKGVVIGIQMLETSARDALEKRLYGVEGDRRGVHWQVASLTP